MKNVYGFYALFCRLELIQRWSLKHCFRKENVLEHSGMVAFLSLLLGLIAKGQGKDVSLHRIVFSSCIHDLSEIITGDVSTPIKHYNERILFEIRKIEKAAENSLLKSSPLPLRNFISECFELTGYEADLVKAVDVYSAFIKAKCEYDSGNREEFRVALMDLEERLHFQMTKVPELKVLHETLLFNLSSVLDSQTLCSIARSTFLAICAGKLILKQNPSFNIDNVVIASLITPEILSSNLETLLRIFVDAAFVDIKSQTLLVNELLVVQGAQTMEDLIYTENLLDRIESLIKNVPDLAAVLVSELDADPELLRSHAANLNLRFNSFQVEIPQLSILNSWFSPSFKMPIDELLQDCDSLRARQKYAKAS